MKNCIPCQKDFSQENIDKNGSPLSLPGEAVLYSGDYDIIFGITEGDNLNTIVGKIALYFSSQITTSTTTTSTTAPTTTTTSSTTTTTTTAAPVTTTTTTSSTTTTTTTIAQPTTHLVEYGVSNTSLDDELVTSVPLTSSITVNNGANSFQFTRGVDNQSLVIREPATEPVKTSYVNGLNNEPMNDYTFKAPVVIGNFRYYYTRSNLRSFDGSSPIILNA